MYFHEGSKDKRSGRYVPTDIAFRLQKAVELKFKDKTAKDQGIVLEVKKE